MWQLIAILGTLTTVVTFLGLIALGFALNAAFRRNEALRDSMLAMARARRRVSL